MERHCPSKSTLYVSMLPYAYTTNDVAQLFSGFGKLARVTLLRQKETRESRGVAFVQFAQVKDCERACAMMNNAMVESFQLHCSISKDNGRSNEFMKKRKYSTKKVCFECKEQGHYSYNCPRNVLGAREKPKNKKRKTKFEHGEAADFFDSSDLIGDIGVASLAFPAAPTNQQTPATRRPTLKPNAYFSDEDALDED